ncbi:MAG: DUF4364 family protein [Clostridia bacterium]|nr:DUF4364 family protein [Clostridia bacterium]
MDFKLDAFPVDETSGGLRSTEKIRIIICYILINSESSLSRDDVLSSLYDNGIANYFEISQAIDNLIDVGAVHIEDGIIICDEKGVKIAKELENELSVYIKNKAVRAAKLTALYEKRKKENEVSITRLSNKNYRLDITLNSGLDNDGEKDRLMDLSLYVTDSIQAESLKNSFLNNPVRVYEKVIEALTEEYEFKE